MSRTAWFVGSVLLVCALWEAYKAVGHGDRERQDRAATEKLSNDSAYQDTTVKFCRDNPQKCRDIVVARGSKLGASHQLWQMNEINKLIWPSTSKIGLVDQAAWNRTVEIAQKTRNAEGATVLTKAPGGTGVHQRLRAEGAGQAGGGEGGRHRCVIPAADRNPPGRRRLTALSSGPVISDDGNAPL